MMMRSRLRALVGTCCLLAGCGGSDTGSVPPTPTPANQAPVFSSPSSASVAENSASDFYQVAATDANNDPVIYTIGGADAARFTLSSSGGLRFTSPPNFEAPADANQDNVYQIVVSASDGRLTTDIAVSVTVTNVPDETTIVQVGGFYTSDVRAITPVPGSKLIFVGQADGSVRIVDPSTQDLGTLYLTVTGASSLLSIAPAPDYATSGRLYVTLRNAAGDLELRRYGRSTATSSDAASADLIFKLPASEFFGGDFPAVNGGWITFGPDGLLYITTASTSEERRVAPDNLAGKVLRIDVSRDDFPSDSERDYGIPATNPFSSATSGREVFATGFRDPRRASFDGNVLIVGDQQGAADSEINLVRPDDAGKSYGFEGVAPVLRLSPQRISQRSFVLGGNVYRGPVPELAGQYIFYAAVTPEGLKSIPAASLVPGTTRTIADVTSRRDGGVLAIGEDADRNFYFSTGAYIYVYRYS